MGPRFVLILVAKAAAVGKRAGKMIAASPVLRAQLLLWLWAVSCVLLLSLGHSLFAPLQKGFAARRVPC